MISIVTILLFFIYLWGLGFSVTYFIYSKNRDPEKPKPDFWEREIMNIGIGLGVFAILSIILNFFRVPLDWKIFLLLSLIVPIYAGATILKKNGFRLPLPTRFPKLVLTKNNLFTFAALFIFAVSLYIYASGAFAYPYLEDEDPWGHSVGVKYVALNKDAYDPHLSPTGAVNLDLSYIDPYPPAYDVLMGILHQTSPNLTWTLKFFNALIIALGFLFFYFFVNLLVQHKTKALVATFFLAALPSYLSHFIWAHSMTITLLFPALYAFTKIFEEKKWAIVLAVVVGGIWVTQNLSQPIKLTTILLIYAVVASVVNYRFLKYHFAGIFGGTILSLFWWMAMIHKYSLQYFFGAYVRVPVALRETMISNSSAGTAVNTAWTAGFSFFGKFLSIIKTITHPGGSGSRAYTLGDFFVAKSNNMINAPIGIGVVLSLLTLFGLAYLVFKYRSSLVSQENCWRIVVLFWLIYTFWVVNGMTFPISIARDAFRTWFLLAIPVSIIAAEGSYVFINTFRKNKLVQVLLTVLIVAGVILTSGVQKYEANTSIWPTSGSFSTSQEPFLYGELFKQLPLNSKVFLYAPRDKLVIGYGMFSCDWCLEVTDFRNEVIYKDANEVYSFLKKNEYQYFMINKHMDYKYLTGKFGQEEVESLLPKRYQEFLSLPALVPIYSNENVILFMVK
ncbi:MAG: hypothetical protein AABX31_05355 [Nanoarchaeota archaeon]